MQPGSQEWLDQVVEDVIDPDQRIVDPHHHLWPEGGALPYGLDALQSDTGAGHHVVATMFVECGAGYVTDGPDHLRPVGETAFVASAAKESATRDGQAEIRGIVSHADLAHPDLGEILDAHTAVGGERFKGIRQSIARDEEPAALTIPGMAPVGLSRDPDFRRGLAMLGERGLIYDSWHYHHQNREFAELAKAVPGTTMVLDHFGTPLGVGRFQGKLDEVFEQWTDDIAAVAANPNVVAKLGGLAMPDNGYGWHQRDRPATSDEVVEAHARWYHRTIECFGPERCMLESNFPVDRFSVSYRLLWNALKKIVSSYRAEERDQMFFATAERVYGL